MKKRDLMRLPDGSKNIQLTDGIYSYTLQKFKTERGFMCIIGVKESYIDNTVAVSYRYEVPEEYYYSNWDSDEEYYRAHHEWSVLAGAGGINIHSKNVIGAIYKLKFIQNGSFKDYVKKEAQSWDTQQCNNG